MGHSESESSPLIKVLYILLLAYLVGPNISAPSLKGFCSLEKQAVLYFTYLRTLLVKPYLASMIFGALAPNLGPACRSSIMSSMYVEIGSHIFWWSTFG